jgi:hypothetical protein
MADWSDFQRGQIFGAHSAGVSVTKTASLLGVSKAAVYSYDIIHKSWEDIISEEE